MIFSMQKIALANMICIAFFVGPAYAQSAGVDPTDFVNTVRKEYGLDHELINGVQYFNRYSRSQGHPYFLSTDYRIGSLTLEGRAYADVSLRFDIYSQHVELRYKNFSGGGNEIVAVYDKVDAFTLGAYQFRKMALEADEYKFYQVLSTGCFSCYIYWEKDLQPLNESFTYINQFNDAKRSLWLDLNGAIYAFSSRKDFSGLFPETQEKEIKRLLSKNKFKFRSSSVDEIIRNLEAVCGLLEEEGER